MNTLAINEWGRQQLSPEDARQIADYLSKNRTSRQVNRLEIDRYDTLRNRGSIVGILQTGIIRIDLKPKVTEGFWEFLPHLIDRISRSRKLGEHIFIDAEQRVTIPRGMNHIPLLALSYISLLTRVLEVGAHKEYVRRQEDIPTIRGRLCMTQLAQRPPQMRNKLPCEYFDLTFDNSINQIVTWAAHRLLGAIRQSGRELRLTRQLREQYARLTQEISLTPKTRTHIQALHHVPQHYRELLKVCEAILTESILDASGDDDLQGVNFLIDMDWLFEQYITLLLEEIATESDGLNVKSQHPRDLCDYGKIKLRPDILLMFNGRTAGIIDVKWKLQESLPNSDFYQVVAYGLAELQRNSQMKEVTVALLAVDPTATELSIINYDEIAEVFEDGKRIRIQIIGIPARLFSLVPNIVEDQLKESLRNYLGTIAV